MDRACICVVIFDLLLLFCMVIYAVTIDAVFTKWIDGQNSQCTGLNVVLPLSALLSMAKWCQILHFAKTSSKSNCQSSDVTNHKYYRYIALSNKWNMFKCDVSKLQFPWQPCTLANEMSSVCLPYCVYKRGETI